MATSDFARPVLTTVVIPAYRSWPTIARVMEALAMQVQGGDREAIVVESSCDGKASSLAEAFPWATVVVREEQTLPGKARNIGTRMARGELLAFIDADAVPSPNWLDELERAMSDAVDAVTSPVLNGTPWHPVGTAAYLLEFAEWLPNRTSPPRHGVTCSLIVRKQLLDEVGGFVEEVFPGEDTILTYPIAKRGRLGFANRTSVSHVNRTSLGDFLRHQVRLGVAFVALCDRTDFPHAWVSRPWGWPLAPILRIVALGLSVRRSPRELAQTVLFLPVILLGLLAWTRGLAKGRSGTPG